MQDKIMLCIDSESLKDPQMIGLSGENILSLDWLDVYSAAGDARKALNSGDDWDRVWVLSCDDMEGINLAAALKRDDLKRNVELVSFGGTGSEVGRCQAAGIDLIRGRDEFVRRYFERKAAQAILKPGVNDDGAFEHEISGELPLDEPLDMEADSGQRLEETSNVAEGETEQNHVDPPRSKIVSRSGHVISVLSGNGGVGKSTIAACLALLFQGRGLKTVLLDLDLQFGDAEFLLGADGSLRVDELVSQPERVSRIEPEGGIPAIVGAPEKLEQSEAVSGSVGDAIEALRQNFDVVIVNTGSFWSDLHIQIIESSDQVLFVLDQRPSSVRSCSRALDLCVRCGIAVQPFHFVLNLCSKHALLSALDVSCALHGVKVGELKDGGREVGELLGAGLPLELMSSKNAFVESLGELASALLPDFAKTDQASDVKAAADKKPLFSGLRKRRAT